MEESAYKILRETAEENWWYKVRKIMARNLIEKYSSGKKGNLKILDIGCGTGAMLKGLENLGTCHGIDNSEQAIKFCKEESIDNVEIGSATRIPRQDGDFDVVLALDILEHIKEEELAIKEMRRVLKDGGLAIIFAPAFRFLWGKSDELGRHYRRYRLKELKSKMADGGFRVVRASYFNFFLFAPIMIIRLLVRIFKIPVESENKTGPKFVNSILYRVFRLESILLDYVDFPFGVSAMVICKK